MEGAVFRKYTKSFLLLVFSNCEENTQKRDVWNILFKPPKLKYSENQGGDDQPPIYPI